MKSFGKSVVMLFVFCTIFSSELEGQLPRNVRDRVFGSTVYIYAEKDIPFETDEGQIVYETYSWAGSGNVLSSDGWIITNSHVAFFDPFSIDPSITYPYPSWFIPDRIYICYTSDPDLEPQPLYYATIVEGLPVSAFETPDIALLKCEWYLDGREIPSDEEIFPDIHIVGDSDEIEHGDKVYCVGYPDYALGGTISLTSGEVTNISTNGIDAFGERVRDYIGTDAAISNGNSGGAAVNQDGKLIGLPTLGEPGGGGFRNYIVPINLGWFMLAKRVEEADMGASLDGRIVSAQTGEGIIGAELYILWPGESVRDILALLQRNQLTDEEYERLNYSIFASCMSVIDGRFSLEHLLPSGYEYSIIVGANNYEIKTAQDYLNINNTNDRNITLELVRR